jgi:hypothetical protein
MESETSPDSSGLRSWNGKIRKVRETPREGNDWSKRSATQ